jgi:hypothetical protein
MNNVDLVDGDGRVEKLHTSSILGDNWSVLAQGAQAGNSHPPETERKL